MCQCTLFLKKPKSCKFAQEVNISKSRSSSKKHRTFKEQSKEGANASINEILFLLGIKMNVVGLGDEERRGVEVEKEVINFSGQKSWR